MFGEVFFCVWVGLFGRGYVAAHGKQPYCVGFLPVRRPDAAEAALGYFG